MKICNIMETMIFEVENIKCGGCASSIKRELQLLDSDIFIGVDVEKGTIKITGPGVMDKNIYIKKLKQMGYSEKGVGNLIDKAKSYISCMIGKIS